MAFPKQGTLTVKKKKKHCKSKNVGSQMAVKYSKFYCLLQKPGLIEAAALNFAES